MNIHAPEDDSEDLSTSPDPLEELIALEEEALEQGIDPHHYITEKIK